MRKYLLVALLFAAMPSAATAEVGAALSSPDCRLRIDTGATTWVVSGFDIFDNTPPQLIRSVAFANDGSGTCIFVPIFRLDIQPYGLSSGSGPRVPYGLLDLYSGFIVTPISGRTERSLTRPYVSLAPNEQQIVQFQFSVPLDSLTDDGEFVQDVVLEAEQSDGSVLGGRPLVLGVDVLPSARMDLSGAFQVNGNQLSVDLGELAAGVAPVPLHLSVQSTRRYRISLDSLNSGQLRLGASEWTIPYQVLIGDHTFTLSSGTSDHSFGASDGYRRESMPMAFIIGSTAERRAGRYADVLSIAVAPQ